MEAEKQIGHNYPNGRVLFMPYQIIFKYEMLHITKIKFHIANSTADVFPSLG